MKGLEAILREHGAGQHGLVTRGQLLKAGVPEHVVERRVRSGRLKPVHRGVYEIGPIRGPGAREMAAVLACGDGEVGRRSAAEAWKLFHVEPGEPVEVVMNRRRRRRIEGVRIHRVNDLEPDEVTVLDGIPVTTPARTLIDVATCITLRELEQALARAERMGLVTREEVRAMVKRHPRHRGARILGRLLEDIENPALTRSQAEEALLAMIRVAGLAQPETNARLLRYEVDFLWRGQRLVVEMDGRAFHDSERAFVEDRQRDAELTAAGYRVMRFTWQDVTRRKEATLVRLAQALLRNSS